MCGAQLDWLATAPKLLREKLSRARGLLPVAAATTLAACGATACATEDANVDGGIDIADACAADAGCAVDASLDPGDSGCAVDAALDPGDSGCAIDATFVIDAACGAKPCAAPVDDGGIDP